MQKILDRIDKILASIENTLVVTIVASMVLMSFLQIILRFFAMAPLWGDVFLRHLVLWVGFIGASLATRDDKHIGIDVLTQISSPGLNKIMRKVVDFSAMLICAILAKVGWDFIQLEREFGSTLFNDIPSWYFQIIIPVGFGLIAFRFLIRILQNKPPVNEIEEAVNKLS